MVDCIFCDIAKGTGKAHKIWEDEKHIAFLSIYPNTRGFSIVIPKKHYPSYAFDVPDDVLKDLIVASKKVGKLLDLTFDDVGRTGLMLEGFGVDHLHSKLFPMHGTEKKGWKPIHSKVDKFFENYEGYISSHDWERCSDDMLSELASRIRRRNPQY